MSLAELVNLFRTTTSFDYAKEKPNTSHARGIPVPVKDVSQCYGCTECKDVCPTKCIQVQKDFIKFDYGACLSCGLCVEACPNNVLKNSGFLYAFSTNREDLMVKYPEEKNKIIEVKASRDLSFLKNGFTYREIAAAGNNSVECELNASFNNTFDCDSNGVRAVASPKHADALLFSGPVGQYMEAPLHKAWNTMPDPKVLIACGT